MNKNIRNLLISAAVVGAAVFAAQSEPSFRTTSFEGVEPNANDKKLNAATLYTSFPVNESGTAEDPVIIWGNGAQVQCMLIQADYVVVRDVIVKKCDTFGIRANGNHIQILNNDVSDVVRMNLNKITGKCDASSSWHSAIRAADASDVLISGNKVSKTCGEGISALRVDGITIENNIVFDAFSVNIYIDQASNATVRNNYSYSTGDQNYYKQGKVARGISIGAESYSGWAFSVHDILIENNTLENVRGINFIQEQAGTPSNVVVQNNIFLNVPAPLVSLGSWATVLDSFTATPSGPTAAPTASRTPTVPAATRTATPTQTATFTQTSTPTRTATSTPAVVPTATANCVPVHSVWVCDKKP